MHKKYKKIIYLDHAATTPIDSEVRRVMTPFLFSEFGNPSSIYSLGQNAKKALNESREAVAKILNASTNEVVFTAGGTESVNLAIFGVVKNFPKGSHIITSKIEHSSVLEPFKVLEKEGYKVSYVSVSKEGLVDTKQLQSFLKKETVFISLMYANNEIGSVQPIAEVGKLVKLENLLRNKLKIPEIIFHTDACQATNFLDLNVQKLGVHLMSVNASKIYGPKQVGALFVKNGVKIKPIIFGGGQERGYRSGTENVAGVVGFAKALNLAKQRQSIEVKKITNLRDFFIKNILVNIPNTFLNGPSIKNKSLNRLPNNVNICFKGVEGEALVFYLDSYGICVSTGSACASSLGEVSHVLKSIGLSEVDAKSSVRFTLGKGTTRSELTYTLSVLKKVISMLRKAL
jgi:cysteine desulfurase